MIRRPTGYLGFDPAEPKLSQIEFIDKDIDDPNRIVLADPVFHAFRKQRALPAIRALNKSLHPIPRPTICAGIIPRESNNAVRFHTASTPSGHRRRCVDLANSEVLRKDDYIRSLAVLRLSMRVRSRGN